MSESALVSDAIYGIVVCQTTIGWLATARAEIGERWPRFFGQV